MLFLKKNMMSIFNNVLTAYRVNDESIHGDNNQQVNHW